MPAGGAADIGLEAFQAPVLGDLVDRHLPREGGVGLRRVVKDGEHLVVMGLAARNRGDLFDGALLAGRLRHPLTTVEAVAGFGKLGDGQVAAGPDVAGVVPLGVVAGARDQQ